MAVSSHTDSWVAVEVVDYHKAVWFRYNNAGACSAHNAEAGKKAEPAACFAVVVSGTVDLAWVGDPP